MMKPVTEEYIKSVLDGTYTRVGSDGRVVTIEPGRVEEGSRQLIWTPEEDEVVLQMRFRNRPWPEIAWVVSRSEDAVKKRHRLIKASRGGAIIFPAKEA